MVHATVATLCTSFDDIRRQLHDSIKAQQERIARMERTGVARRTAKAHPVCYLVAVCTSGLAVACAWRLVSEKWRYEVRATQALTVMPRPSPHPQFARSRPLLASIVWLRVFYLHLCCALWPAQPYSRHWHGRACPLDLHADHGLRLLFTTHLHAQAEEASLQAIITNQKIEIDRYDTAVLGVIGPRPLGPWNLCPQG
jgi:hypothetical protein